MASRRDQLLSYQFMVQRVVSAFVYRDADLAQVPFRRAATTLFISVMLAVVTLGATAIYGLVVKGGKTGWKNPEAVIIEKETGARYVYLDGHLHPVVNYASARLILKQANPQVIYVSTASLKDAPRGAMLGITGIPDSLPPSGRMLTNSWTLCSQPENGTGGRSVQKSVLYITGRTYGGDDLGDSAVLVRHPDDSVFLVWHDSRFLVKEPRAVLDALSLGQEPVLPASAAWVNAVPQGPDIAPIDIDGRGRPSQLAGARVGQVLVSQSVNGTQQYFAVLADGVADITQVQADILLHDPATAAAYPNATPQQIRRADLGKAPRSATRLLPPGDGPKPPTDTPKIARLSRADAGLCLNYRSGVGEPAVSVDVALPAPDDATAAVTPDKDGPVLADRVVVAPGAGVLVRADPNPKAADGPVSVVTDLGVRYPLGDADTVNYLGYTMKSAVRMPASLVSLIPAGRSLDPAKAGRPVSVG